MCATRLRLAALATVALLAAAGCHASSQPTGAGAALPTVAGAAAVPIETYCDALADEACARQVPCCTAEGQQTDVATCHAAKAAECDRESAVQKAKGYRYDAQSAGVCLAGAQYFFDGCRASSTPPYWTTTLVADACARIWTGAIPAGGACVDTPDCASQPNAVVSCARTGGSPTGTCVAIPRVALGASCNLRPDGKPFVACAEGLYCGSTTATSTTETKCRTPASVGGSCLPGDVRSCADSLYCNTKTSLCAPLAGVDQSCDGVECATGLYCEGTRMRCTAPKLAGESCDSAPCAAGLFCDDSLKCSGPKAIGEACNRGPCAAPGYCRYSGGSPVCTAPIPVGSRCSYDDICEGAASCVDGTCVKMLADGASCTWSGECASRICKFSAGTGTCAGGSVPSGGGRSSTSDNCRGIVATSSSSSPGTSGSAPASGGSAPPSR